MPQVEKGQGVLEGEVLEPLGLEGSLDLADTQSGAADSESGQGTKRDVGSHLWGLTGKELLDFFPDSIGIRTAE
jgi:hypothetical protein